MAEATAAKIIVLSAGAVQPGMTSVIEAFRRETGHDFQLTFATAPSISKRIAGGDNVDVVVAPEAVLDELVSADQASPHPRVTVGRIGVGVMIKESGRL